MGLILRVSVVDEAGNDYLEATGILLSDKALNAVNPDYRERARIISTTETVLRETLKLSMDKWNIEHPSTTASTGFKL